MISGEKSFIKAAKELLGNIGFLVLALENADEKDKAAEQILRRLDNLLELCRSYDLEEIGSVVEGLIKLIREVALRGKPIDYRPERFYAGCL